ncbi:MAG: amino acid permease [Firmicutes bacterium]|nr:amino acid permease [Bacillota bacterium]
MEEMNNLGGSSDTGDTGGGGSANATSGTTETNGEQASSQTAGVNLTRKYGLIVAICMVVGSMIGSGIFFRTEMILNAIGANLWLGILAWVIGGLITISFAYCFANLATRHEKSGGFVDYTEKLVGKRAAYFVGWFVATIYFPFSAAILAFVAARFTIELFAIQESRFITDAYGEVIAGFQFASGETMAIAVFYMIALYVINMLAPKIGGKIQVSTTVIKVIPLILMGVVGVIAGLVNGTTIENVQSGFEGTADGNPFFFALVATAFAFAGWETVTSLNSEVKNSKRNLPIALIFGILLVIALYILYFVGVFSAGNIEAWGGAGTTAFTYGAFENIFGSVAGTILVAFIVVSCLGTTNAFMMVSGKAFYSLSVRDEGPAPRVFKEVDKHSNMPLQGSNLALLFMALWLGLWFMQSSGWTAMPWTMLIVPVTVNLVLIPIFVGMMLRESGMHWFNRFVAPVIAIAGSVFMIGATIYTQELTVLWYLIIVAGFMAVGAIFPIVKHFSEKKEC